MFGVSLRAALGAAGAAAAVPFLPETYGAIGDGVADDRAAIMSACTAAAAATPKGTVWLGAGKTYRVVQTAFSTRTVIPVINLVSTHAGITIASDPNNRATIKLRTDPPGGGTTSEILTPVIGLTNTTGVTLRDFIIDGSRTAYNNNLPMGGVEDGAMHGIRFFGGSGHRVLGRMSIIRCLTDGIMFRGACDNILVDGEAHQILIDESGRLGMGVINCTNVTVRKVKGDRSGYHIGANQARDPRAFMDVEPNNNNTVENFLMEDFEIDRSASRAFTVDNRENNRNVKNWTIRNGVCTNSAQFINNEAIRIRDTADTAESTSDIKVENVICDKHIRVGGTGASAVGKQNRLTITGCSLPSTAQILLQHTVGDAWNITGNTRTGSSDVVQETNVTLTNSTIQP